MRLICGHCGHANPPGASFCEECDEYLDWTAVEAPDEAAPARVASGAGPVPGPGGPATGTGQVPAVSTTATIDVPTRSCPSCATANPVERRFCRRCGAWLVSPPAVPAGADRDGWRGWWRRLVGPMNSADRAAYRRSLSPATRAFRVALVALVVVVLVVVLSPVAGDPVGRAADAVRSRLGTGRVDRTTLTVTPLPGGKADVTARSHLAFVDDGVRDTSWGVPWTRDAGPQADSAGACAAQPPDPDAGFVVTFPRATDVREIGVESGGVGETSTGMSHAWLPAVVDLQWTVVDGDATRSECQRLTLAPTPDLQRFRVTAGAVTQLRVVVLSASRPPKPEGAAFLRVGELTLWER